MKKPNTNRKKLVAIIAMAAIVVSALGMSYAWVDYSQHKSNELNGGASMYDVRLVEDFEEVNDWKVEDGPVKKNISAVNLGQSAEGYGEVYVRIQLKEYMEIAPLSYTMTEKRYMIDTKGEFIVYATEAEAITATAAGGAYAGHSYALLTDVATNKTGYFIETQDHDPNGQMGKYVVTGIAAGTAQKVIAAGPGRAGGTNHHNHPSEECDYAPRTWDGNELETREYIEWILNDADIILLSDWDGVPVAKWIIDDSAAEGWVYWGQALQPDGGSTALFMDAVVLIAQPEGSFYYVIHTDMEAVSFDEILSGNVDWGDVGDGFRKNAPSAAWNGATPSEVKVGETVNSPGLTIGPAGAAQGPLAWSSSNPSLATVDQDGVVTGVLAGGPVTITVTAPNGARVRYSLMVLSSGVPPQVPAIPVKQPNDGNAFKPVWDDDPMLGDGHYEHVFYPDRSLPAPFNEFFHNGSIHLEDIISDGNYTGVTAAPSDPKYASYISVGTDKCGKPSVIYSYVPTEDEFKALVAALANPGDDFFVPVGLTLTRGTDTAGITINMYYWDSLMVASGD